MIEQTTIYARASLKIMYVLLFFAVILSSCRRDDDYFNPPAGQQGKLIDQLRADPQFSTFLRALELTKLDRTVGSSGLYTLFPPTNDAFQEYLNNNQYQSLEQIPPKQLYELVGNHIITPMMFTFDFAARRFNNKKDDRYQTNALKYARVIRTGDTFTINGVNVLPDKRDISTENGSIHGVPQVLIPGLAIDSLTQVTDNVKIFNRALKRFSFLEFDPRRSLDIDDDGIIDSIFIKRSRLLINPSAEDPELTAFAPTDDAFKTFLSQYPQYSLVGQDSLNIPDNVLKPIIEYHLVSGAKSSTGVTGELTTAGNEKLQASAIKIAQADVKAANGALPSNGYLHKISKVLLPPSLQTVGGEILLNRNNDLGTFIAALEKAALLRELLKTDKAYTIFAPTNQAFADAGININELTGAQLEPILKGHILTQTLPAASLVDGKLYPSMQGPALKISGTNIIDAKGLPSNIIATDFTGNNGVFHKIDGVLQQPANKIVATFINQPQFTEFKAAMEKAGLLTALDGTGPYTIFAPTNQAFQDFYTQLGVSGLAGVNSALLKDILQYHVLGERFFSTNATNGLEKGTLLTNSKFRFVVAGDMVKINDNNAVSPDATVVATDLQGTNGVMHTIDKVLQP